VKADARDRKLSGGYVPRLRENSKCCRIGGYLDPYPIGDRGLQRILRDRISRTRFRAEFSHSLCPERSFLFLPLTFNICDHSGVAIAFFTSCNIDMNTRLRRCVFMPCGCMSSLRDFLRACSYQSYSFPGACCPCRVLTVLSGHEACYLVRTRHGTGSG
jgi:hypothetical protein